MPATSNFLQAGQKLQSDKVSLYELHNPHLTMATQTAGIATLSNLVTWQAGNFGNCHFVTTRPDKAAKNPRTVISPTHLVLWHVWIVDKWVVVIQGPPVVSKWCTWFIHKIIARFGYIPSKLIWSIKVNFWKNRKDEYIQFLLFVMRIIRVTSLQEK